MTNLQKATKAARRLFFFFLLSALHLLGADDPLTPWRNGVIVRPVAPALKAHSLHAYFTANPESPDGQWVLFYTSTTADGHHGEIRIRHRQTGEEKILARNVTTEDAHRAACQQWLAQGRRVVFHDERQGEWLVASVEIATGQERILARGRLAGWGNPHSSLLPIYGLHWNPGEHRDLELVDTDTGAIRTALTASAVGQAYGSFLKKQFGDQPFSIFFPVLSPNAERVFFKLAAAGNGDARSTAASKRLGLICYDLAQQRFLYQSEKWGHPAWYPDSRQIAEANWIIYDSDTGKSQRLPGLPGTGSGHPNVSPDTQLMATDLTMDKLGGREKDWGIVLADMRGTNYVLLTQFDNSKGAKSWRRSHPHPVFNADGRRLYFNVSSNQWTQLFVAERASPPPSTP